MKRITFVALSIFCLSLAGSFAKDSAMGDYRQVLSSVPTAEMPAKAADVVKQTKARNWGSTTAGVVKSAVTMNPAAAPAIVGAVARAVPEMAALAAGTAAAEQPKQAAAIAKAATAAAPSKAGKIVVAVCRAVPSDYKNIAVAVSLAAPGSSKEVLKAVAQALPELKPGIEKALSGYTGNTVLVASVLDQAGSKDGTTARGPSDRGPSVGPPFIPLSGSATTITPATSGEVPTGGRDYANP